MLLGVDHLGQLALREVGDLVLVPTAKLVDDLLPVDVHLALLSGVVAALPACLVLAVGGSTALLCVVVVALDTSEPARGAGCIKASQASYRRVRA